jgi:hypothetical protein
VEPGFITKRYDTIARVLGRRTGFASDSSASRPIGFDRGYKTARLVSGSRCGLGEGLFAKQACPSTATRVGRRPNLKALAPTGSTGRGRRSIGFDLGYKSCGLVSVSHCGLGGVWLAKQACPSTAARVGHRSNLKALAPTGSTGRARRSIGLILGTIRAGLSA